jgi:putative zinc finger/helix-turn-helix YgiT family protein
MGNQDPVIGFPDMKSNVCPACGKEMLESMVEETSFTYGTGATAVDLSCPVSVHRCSGCGFEFTDSEAEDARDLAVRRYFRVMLPEEIRGIRESNNISRREFGSITRIGEASLARWESGDVIQNAGYDQFLYLLKFPENFQRLKDRPEENNEQACRLYSASSLQSRFPSIRGFDQKVVIAEEWKLRKAG